MSLVSFHAIKMLIDMHPHSTNTAYLKIYSSIATIADIIPFNPYSTTFVINVENVFKIIIQVLQL